MTAFGFPGRARGEEEFGDRVRRHGAMCSGNASRIFCAKQFCEHRRLAIAERIAGDNEFDLVGHGFINGSSKRPTISGIDQSGREQVDDGAQFAEVARHQRVGGRDRRVRDADIHRAERKQSVLDVVAGQDHERPLRGQPASQQRRTDTPYLGERLGIGALAPLILRITLGEEQTVGCSFGPMFERLAQLAVVITQRLSGADVNGAVRAPIQHSVRCAKPHRTQRCDACRITISRIALGIAFANSINRASPWARAFPENPSVALSPRHRPAQSTKPVPPWQSRLPDSSARSAVARA